MADNFHAEIPQLKAWTARFDNGAKIVNEELAVAGTRSGLSVETSAKRYVRVWRHDLQRSITSKGRPFGTNVTPLGVTTKIGTTKKYALAEEFGRPAGRPMPPPGALLGWMAAKSIPVSERDTGFTEAGSREGTRRLAKGVKRFKDDKGKATGFSTRQTRSRGVDAAGKNRAGYYPVEYLIARSIKRKAPDPHPYLTKAFNELKPQIRKEFALVPKRVIARLKAGA